MLEPVNLSNAIYLNAKVSHSLVDLLFLSDYCILRSQHLKNKHGLHQSEEGPQDPGTVVKIIAFKKT